MLGRAQVLVLSVDSEETVFVLSGFSKPSCAGQMNVCANCEGELVRRPRRKETPNSGAGADA
jgi:hypothetical protein